MTAQLALFSENALAESLEKVMKFLAERGVKIQHGGMLKALDQAGARVDFDTEIVCFPNELVEGALKKAPSSFTLAAPDSKFDLPLPHPAGSVYFCTGTGARGFIDPISGTYRRVTISDVGLWGGLANALENIDLCAFPTPTDVPAETVDVHSLKALLESSAKHIWIQPHTEASLPYLLELAAARAGGVEKLSDRPMVSIIACSLTPFRFKPMDVEVILQACEHGIPIHASSLPVIGATSPINTMGTVLVAGIEVLAMISMAQIIQPGIPVIGLATALNMDMRSGRAVKAGPEAMMVNAASAQFFRWLRIPTHTAGLTTDTVLPDGQAMAEHSLYGLLVAAAGANIIGRAGELEAAKTISPIQLIVDNEIAAVLKCLYKGTELSAETMVWEDILSIAPGGHFLETEHTLKHCREAFEPRLFMHQSRDQWESQGVKDLQRRARDIYEELVSKVEQPEISESRRAEMDRIVRKADRTLAR